MNYDLVFFHCKNKDFLGLYEALAPWLEMWANDVLRPMHSQHNDCWRGELVSVGAVSLAAELPKRFNGSKMVSGQHVINSLRLPVRKAMRAALRALFPVPIPAAQTFRNRIKKGQPAFKSWEPRRRVVMEGTLKATAWNTGASQAVIDERFSAHDETKAASYWEFTYLAAESAIQETDGTTNRLVRAILDGASTVTEAAKLAGLARGTARDRLRRLGGAIAASSNSELRDLGLEHRPSIWTPAAKTDATRHGHKGPSSAWASNPSVPRQK